MILYSASIYKRYNQSLVFRGHMNYLANSTARLYQGGKGRYVGREGVPKDNSSGENVNL